MPKIIDERVNLCIAWLSLWVRLMVQAVTSSTCSVMGMLWSLKCGAQLQLSPPVERAGKYCHLSPCRAVKLDRSLGY
jgi:hypothetical protein